MVSGTGIPETTSTSGTVTAVAGKKQWVSPVVHTIDLETAQYFNISRSPDGTRPSRVR